ncbi:MAG TPA: hypothetical protein VFJ82_26510 [Longimicrobium sp.]|nr:hypothetical protein [Longimicrobium sp.]
MRKLVHAAAAATLLLSSTACQNALGDDYGPMTGTWKVTITAFEHIPADPGTLCDVETTYVIRQVGNEMEGRSTPAVAHCANPATGRSFDVEKFSGVVRGPVEDGRIDVSDYGDWHCIAELNPTRIVGYMESYGGIVGQERVVRSGTCVLEKISDQGYDGPEA